MLTGTILNALGILTGGLLGLTMARQFTPATQMALRGLMGVFTVIIGLRLTWSGLTGNFFQIFKGVVIMTLALVVGRLIGRLLRIQETLNRFGHYAANDSERRARRTPICSARASPSAPCFSARALWAPSARCRTG